MLLLSDKEGILKKLQENTCIHLRDGSGCWEYLGTIHTDGYGVLWVDSTSYLVHRLSLYIYKNFDLDSKLEACHILTCKRKDCWNPEHLYAGTHSENMSDYSKSKTHCPKGHEYTTENTYINNSRLSKGRTCRICAKISSRNQKIRLKKEKEKSK